MHLTRQAFGNGNGEITGRWHFFSEAGGFPAVQVNWVHAAKGQDRWFR
jgi:hypothetical protein